MLSTGLRACPYLPAPFFHLRDHGRIDLLIAEKDLAMELSGFRGEFLGFHVPLPEFLVSPPGFFVPPPGFLVPLPGFLVAFFEVERELAA
jgi:hypothetical protein